MAQKDIKQGDLISPYDQEGPEPIGIFGALGGVVKGLGGVAKKSVQFSVSLPLRTIKATASTVGSLANYPDRVINDLATNLMDTYLPYVLGAQVIVAFGMLGAFGLGIWAGRKFPHKQLRAPTYFGFRRPRPILMRVAPKGRRVAQTKTTPHK